MSLPHRNHRRMRSLRRIQHAPATVVRPEDVRLNAPPGFPAADLRRVAEATAAVASRAHVSPPPLDIVEGRPGTLASARWSRKRSHYVELSGRHVQALGRADLELIIGHELGHVARGHYLKSLRLANAVCLTSAAAMVTTFVTTFAAHGMAGIVAAGATGIGAIAAQSPLLAAQSRRHEIQAERDGARSMADPAQALDHFVNAMTTDAEVGTPPSRRARALRHAAEKIGMNRTPTAEKRIAAIRSVASPGTAPRGRPPMSL